MARKKKRKNRRTSDREVETSTSPFNPVFPSPVVVEKEDLQPDTGPVENPPGSETTASDQENVFFQAMADVTPLKSGKATVFKLPDPNLRPPHPVRDEEMEAVAHLSDLVAGNAEMDITFSDEYMEGSIHGLNPKLMRALKKGNFPFQDYIDLHGLTRQEAEAGLKEFLIHSRTLGRRCVLVVHGRGLNSENKICVLKENIPAWLSSGVLKRMVLAFCTARPYDGGTGAVYVMLRNPRRR